MRIKELMASYLHYSIRFSYLTNLEITYIMYIIDGVTMKCPHCDSNRMVKAGKAYYSKSSKQRYMCVNCRKITTKPKK